MIARTLRRILTFLYWVGIAILVVADILQVPSMGQSVENVAPQGQTALTPQVPDWQAAAGGHMQFEVASIKPNKERPPAVTPRSNVELDTWSTYPYARNGGFLSATDQPLIDYISFAYKLKAYQFKDLVSQLPKWPVGLDRFDIQARAEGNPTRDQMRLMMQSLLADRFKLAIHRETKEVPIWTLVVANGGPKLQKAEIEEKDCPDPSAISNEAGREPHVACHTFKMPSGRGRGIHAQAVDMSELVAFVEGWTDRPLVDKTSLKGLYRIDTKGWLPMEVGPEPGPGAKAEDGRDVADVPTIFELFESLGLKMESQRGAEDRYVIDHIEQPSEN